MSIVWSSPITPPSLKLTALALADWSNDEGGSLHPSLAAIARKVGVSRPQAQRLIRELKRAGLLTVVANAAGGAPTTTPHYRLKLERIAAWTGITGDAGRGITGDAGTGITDAQGRASPMHRTGIAGDAQTTKEPSMNRQEGVAAQPRRQQRAGDHPPAAGKARMPKAGKVTFAQFLEGLEEGQTAIPEGDDIWRFAKRIGMSPDLVALAWRVFRRRYLVDSPDKVYVDWRAVFRRAVREDWLRLWHMNPDGRFVLTTAGQQEQRAAEQEALHA